MRTQGSGGMTARPCLSRGMGAEPPVGEKGTRETPLACRKAFAGGRTPLVQFFYATRIPIRRRDK